MTHGGVAVYRAMAPAVAVVGLLLVGLVAVARPALPRRAPIAAPFPPPAVPTAAPPTASTPAVTRGRRS